MAAGPQVAMQTLSACCRGTYSLVVATPKTRPTGADVTVFLDAVPDERRRREGHAVRALLEYVTGEPAQMWGPSIVGFGSQTYTGNSGTSNWFVVGFAPRKGALTIYGVYDESSRLDPLFAQLGPYTTGKGCLYLKRLDAVEQKILERLIRRAWERRGIDGSSGQTIRGGFT